MTTITIPTLDESIERMKQEIIDDIKAGQVPANCPSFSALHDYVDANCYGGFCEEAEMQALMDHFGGLDEEEGTVLRIFGRSPIAWATVVASDSWSVLGVI